MTSITEQFSAARITQLDNGFNLMQSFSEQAFDRTSRVVALQFEASRAAIAQSSEVVRQLLAVRDPRDLLALGAQSQQNLRTMFNFGSELFSIAAGTGFTPLRSYSADALNAITTANAAAAQQTVDAAVSSLAPVQASAEDQTAAAVAIVTSDVAPEVEPTAIARAAGEVLEVPVAPPHPVAASVPVEVSVEIELPKVEPVDATPPVVAPATNKVTELRGSKGRRKQN